MLPQIVIVGALILLALILIRSPGALLLLDVLIPSTCGWQANARVQRRPSQISSDDSF
jgi:hypothetical protein